MRLTLRTLLAWLDDTLPADQVREIGPQVAESSYARELVERIKSSTRRRRLTIPPHSGPDSVDPNLVANYLDNVLSTEQVAEFEKKCLSSDVRLAEVASVHQILSLIGQRAKVPTEARLRMYGIARGPESVHRAVPRNLTLSETREVGINGSQTASESAESVLDWQRYLPLALVCVLLAVFVGSAIVNAGKAHVAGATPVLTVEELRRRAIEEEKEKALQLLAAEEAAKAPRVKGGEGTPIAVAPTDGAAPVAAPVDGAKPAQPVAIIDGRAEIPAGASGAVVDVSGIALIAADDERSWKRLGKGVIIEAGSHVVNLNMSRTTIALPHHGRLVLDREGELRFREPDAGVDAAIEVVDGRMILIAGDSARAISVRTPACDPMRIELEPGGRIGLERVVGAPLANMEVPCLAIYVPAGMVKIERGDEEASIKGPKSLILMSDHSLPLADARTIPDWVDSNRATPLEEALAGELVSAFRENQPPLNNLVELLEDPAEIAQKLRPIAIDALARVGQLELVIGALNKQGDHGARMAAIDVLRRYALLGPDSLANLRTKLVEFEQADWASMVESLLHGLPRGAVEDRAVMERLYSLLSHKDPGVRELALANLKRLTNHLDDLGYNADEPEGAGLKAWKDLLERLEFKEQQRPAPPAAKSPAPDSKRSVESKDAQKSRTSGGDSGAIPKTTPPKTAQPKSAIAPKEGAR